jgi:hypothetical protein
MVVASAGRMALDAMVAATNVDATTFWMFANALLGGLTFALDSNECIRGEVLEVRY